MRLRTSQAKLSKISHSSKFTPSFERTTKFYSDYSYCIHHQCCSSNFCIENHRYLAKRRMEIGKVTSHNDLRGYISHWLENTVWILLTFGEVSHRLTTKPKPRASSLIALISLISLISLIFLNSLISLLPLFTLISLDYSHRR